MNPYNFCFEWNKSDSFITYNSETIHIQRKHFIRIVSFFGIFSISMIYRISIYKSNVKIANKVNSASNCFSLVRIFTIRFGYVIRYTPTKSYANLECLRVDKMKDMNLFSFFLNRKNIYRYRYHCCNLLPSHAYNHFSIVRALFIRINSYRD